MKKRYTKKQITEAIAYWKKQLNEGLFSSSPVKKFMNELKVVTLSLQSTLIGASKKDGKTFMVSDFEYNDGCITFFTDDTKLYRDKLLEGNELIEKLVGKNVKAKQIASLYVKFSDGVYSVSGITVGKVFYGKRNIIILNVDASSTVVNKFFS